jgi:hypothetical protein
MIPRLTQLKEKLANLNPVVLEGIQETFQDNDSVVEDLNISQLQMGQRSDGTFLPDYSPRSVAVFGKPPGPIRLFDTGAFYRGITLTAARELAELAGRDEKTDELEFEYGERIIGLSEENRRMFQNVYLREGIHEALRESLWS